MDELTSIKLGIKALLEVTEATAKNIEVAFVMRDSFRHDNNATWRVACTFFQSFDVGCKVCVVSKTATRWLSEEEVDPLVNTDLPTHRPTATARVGDDLA
eukprot:2582662-Amphidinium_carterae.1